ALPVELDVDDLGIEAGGDHLVVGQPPMRHPGRHGIVEVREVPHVEDDALLVDLEVPHVDVMSERRPHPRSSVSHVRSTRSARQSSGTATVSPPSTGMFVPVTYAEASDASQIATPRRSSVVPHGPRGTSPAMAAAAAGFSTKARLTCVSIQPGVNMFTRTPDLAHSCASACVRLRTPALATPYGVMTGQGRTVVG